MKIYILVVVLASAAIPGKTELSKEAQQLMQEVANKCIDQSGVDSAVIKDANEGRFADDPKLKEFALCFAKTVGFINDAGDIMLDHIKNVLYAHLEKDVADGILSKCMEKKATPQETAFEMGKCMQPHKDG